MRMPLLLGHDQVLRTSQSVPEVIAPTHIQVRSDSMPEPVMPVEHSLPFNRNLLITTPDSIHLRTPAGDKTVFECQSADGIVNACAAPNNSSLLAIADSHGVTLHDTAQPREKKHKLKGGGVSSKDHNSVDLADIEHSTLHVCFSSLPTRVRYSSTPRSTTQFMYSHCRPVTCYTYHTRIHHHRAS
jgi:hypothetical protein